MVYRVLSPLNFSQDAGRSYVDDTLFIGDSNTVRYTMYADDTGTAFSTLKNNIGVVIWAATWQRHPAWRTGWPLPLQFLTSGW